MADQFGIVAQNAESSATNGSKTDQADFNLLLQFALNFFAAHSA
jgi:hypothetical protein